MTNFLLIAAFTVVIDIGRNIGKILVLVFNSIKNKISPRTFSNIKPKISIIIPAHNEGVSIRNSILSVLENKYENKEIIVVDDHSTDDTYIQALPFKENGSIKLVKRTGAMGSKARAINYGSLFATGEYIMIMDGDTLLQRNALKNISPYLTLPDTIAVSGNVRVLSGDNNVKNLLTKCQSYEYLISLELGRRYNALMKMLLIIPGAFGVFPKATGKQVGLYDPDNIVEDFDMTLKLLKIGGRIEFATNSIAWTFCPSDWRSWIKQRIRWSFGQMDILFKHKDVLKSKTFRRPLILAVYDMIGMDIILLFVRMGAVIWLAFNFSESIFYVYFLIYLLYFLNEVIVIGTAAAFSPNKSDIKYIYLAPFIVTIYRPIYTYVRLYAYLKRLVTKTGKWQSY